MITRITGDPENHNKLKENQMQVVLGKAAILDARQLELHWNSSVKLMAGTNRSVPNELRPAFSI